MADIRPFCGLRFDPRRVDPGAVICPPFDVISPAAQRAYHERDPHNVIRLELGLGSPDPAAPDNWYKGAAETLRAWQQEGVLIRDDRPAIYLYAHEFTHAARPLARRSLLVAGRLHDREEQVVLPHEDTRAGPIQSRLALLRATNMNVSPLWLVYDDPQGEVGALLERAWAHEPVAVAEADGQRHILWVVPEPGLLRALVEALAPKQLFIADGHHRYQTAQIYRDEQRRRVAAAGGRPDPDAGYEFALMMLVALDDPGMLLLPTHRLVRALDRPPAEVRAALARWFTLSRLQLPAGDDAATAAFLERALADAARERAEAGAPAHVFGLLEREGAWLLRLREDCRWEARLPRDRSAAWRSLDVAVFDTLVLRDVLGIRAEGEAAHASAPGHGAADRLAYTADFREAVAAVREGEAVQAYLLNATPMAQVCAVAAAGDRMPPKSTYFHPKPATGLVMHPLDGVRQRP
jgi:uncharacterized protein (DUF1015 family)